MTRRAGSASEIALAKCETHICGNEKPNRNNLQQIIRNLLLLLIIKGAGHTSAHALANARLIFVEIKSQIERRHLFFAVVFH